MSGVMLNFKGKMYKLCEQKDMDRKSKSVVVATKKPSIKSRLSGKPTPPQAKQPTKPPKRIVKAKKPTVGAKTRSDKGGTHKMPKDSKPVKPKKATKPKKAPVKPKKAKKAKKQMKVEGFPSFKGDEPRAKEEKRRENNLY